MYKLPIEIKKVILISLIVVGVIILCLVWFKPIYAINFFMGYLASVLSLLKNNYFITSVLYKVYPGTTKTMITNNILGDFLYLIALGPSFYLGLVNGIFCVVGLLVIKVILILCYGFSGKEA